ncbi:NAD-dependent epimerase/dehydratase family protein [Dyella sp.]|uniref:NAD-dependent epimerase/dehydratase family protein n=1 Tax=Dyella sp. TaxID=1869338 RepID=UPI002B45CADA|nr:NAD-dependent epimerase/dehydratase family protein [Dyella sp.]HKT30086.1 NAD-dependent epimerase/dehydratase family protein [Dyella sp.]
MAERILIAGCGDLGERVAYLLLAQGDEVHALRRHPPGEAGGIRWLAADLAGPETLVALPEGITRLIFLPAPDARQADIYRAVFLDGLRNVLDALDTASLQRVLFVSSSAVYGEHGEEWVDEATPPAPLGFNGRILREAELALQDDYPCDSIVLRLAGLYGPGRLQLIDRLRAGQVSAPRQTRHWANRIHVDDAAAAIVHLLTLRDHQALYVGADDTPLPLDVLYDGLAAMVGAPKVADGSAPAGVGSKRLSNARLKASGFRFRWPDTLKGYAALLDNGASSAD